ncbi:chaperone modulator CbpM [Pseudoruegeria sp. SK021]|uniref:chaperone modulator CbpM n=1 Tax=Pseudoruegeria sp. SK021 TaxID=1933035 RepID=UPI000A2454C8|nr:chaperone modulator CbpM [Pseudoruegeria sp. SK021]OSP56127.1 hypothetical protein BV911_04100 [Pseudoruegeria sp. SK021]
MTDRYSEDEVLAAVTRLTRSRLVTYVEAEIVMPLHTPQGPVFQRADLARLTLMCELAEGFDLDEDGLGIVLSLIDQLHQARQDLHSVAQAVAQEPEAVRHRIGTRLFSFP